MDKDTTGILQTYARAWSRSPRENELVILSAACDIIVERLADEIMRRLLESKTMKGNKLWKR